MSDQRKEIIGGQAVPFQRANMEPSGEVTFRTMIDNGEEWPGIEPEDTHCARGAACAMPRPSGWLNGKPILPYVGRVIGPYLGEVMNGYDQWRWDDCYYFESAPDTLFCEDCMWELENVAEPEEWTVTSGEVRGVEWSISLVENVGANQVRGFLPVVSAYTPPDQMYEKFLPVCETLGEAQAQIAAWIAEHGCQHEHTSETCARPGARIFVECEECGDSWPTDRWDTA